MTKLILVVATRRERAMEKGHGRKRTNGAAAGDDKQLDVAVDKDEDDELSPAASSSEPPPQLAAKIESARSLSFKDIES